MGGPLPRWPSHTLHPRTNTLHPMTCPQMSFTHTLHPRTCPRMECVCDGHPRTCPRMSVKLASADIATATVCRDGCCHSLSRCTLHPRTSPQMSVTHTHSVRGPMHSIRGPVLGCPSHIHSIRGPVLRCPSHTHTPFEDQYTPSKGQSSDVRRDHIDFPISRY